LTADSSRGSASGKIYLDMPVTYLKGVGPMRAEALQRLGILTARDILFHIPRRYEDASTVKPISSLEPGMDATIVGRVVSKGIIPTRKGLRIFQRHGPASHSSIERSQRTTRCCSLVQSVFFTVGSFSRANT
jgi:RecG-like helicase